MAICRPGMPSKAKRAANFRDARGTFGDYDKLDKNNDREDDQAHDNIIAGHELTKTLDHAAGRQHAVDLRAGKNQSRGGHVQNQAG